MDLKVKFRLSSGWLVSGDHFENFHQYSSTCASDTAEVG